jgi:hypothetical protein
MGRCARPARWDFEIRQTLSCGYRLEEIELTALIDSILARLALTVTIVSRQAEPLS